MLRRSSAGLVLALVLVSANAHAEDPNLPVVETHRRWYGWQSLTCDALAFTAFYIAGKTASADSREAFFGYFQPTWAAVGATAFYGCGPVMHLTRDHPARALGDLGLRIVVTVPTLAFFGVAASNEHGEDAELSRSFDYFFGAIFAVGGAAATVAVDATIMSRETTYKVVPRSLTVTPDIESRRGGGTLGLRGTF